MDYDHINWLKEAPWYSNTSGQQFLKLSMLLMFNYNGAKLKKVF